MDDLKCWRGTHGDVRPVEVLRRGAVNAAGSFRSGYYATEVEAWSGVLACWAESVSVCEGEEARAYQDYLNARRETVAAQQRQAQAGQHYEAWRRGLTVAGAARLLVAVG